MTRAAQLCQDHGVFMSEFAVFRVVLLSLAVLSGAALAVEPGTLLPQVTVPGGAENDFLGFAVAISPPDDQGGRFAAVGTVDRFVAVSNEWRPGNPDTPNLVLAQRLTSPVGFDNWGLAVAIRRQPGDQVFVGAPGHDSSFLNSGRAYVYQRGPLGVFLFSVAIDPPNASNVGNFGTVLAITPDGQLLLIGEPRAQRNDAEVGAVHVYNLATSPPTLTLTLFGTAGFGGLGGRFGQSLAVDNQRLTVGAPLEDDAIGTIDTGAVHVYRREGNVYVAETGPLYASDRLTGDRLGLSVSIAGDRLLAGAANDDKPAGVDAGGAYAFERSLGGTWQEVQKLRSGQPQLQERYAQSVLVTGEHAYIGAYCVNASGCSGPGALYQYRRNAGSWELVQRHSPADGGSFGFTTATDGASTVLVGSYTAFGNATNSGAVYLLRQNEVLLADGFEGAPR